MDHPVLVLSNNGKGNQRNHDQTCIRQFTAITRQKETIPFTQESDASSSINTVEIVSSNGHLLATLRPYTILQ